jgi:hypothetical protein
VITGHVHICEMLGQWPCVAKDQAQVDTLEAVLWALSGTQETLSGPQSRRSWERDWAVLPHLADNKTQL